MRHTALALLSLGGLRSHAIEVVFVLSVVPVQEGSWVHGSLFFGSLIWQLLNTFPAMGTTSCNHFKESHYYFGSIKNTLNIYMKCQTKLPLRKRVTILFQHDPHKEPNTPFFYGRLEKQLWLSTHQRLKLWYLAPLALLTVHIRNKLFFHQSRPRGPVDAGLQKGCADCRQEPSAHGPNPSVFKYWPYTSFQKEVPERRLKWSCREVPNIRSRTIKQH